MGEGSDADKTETEIQNLRGPAGKRASSREKNDGGEKRQQ